MHQGARVPRRGSNPGEHPTYLTNGTEGPPGGGKNATDNAGRADDRGR